MEIQLDIFNIIESKKINSTYESIKKKLAKYSIDKIYEEKFKGQCAVLWTIKEELTKQKNYKEYYAELIKELAKILPVCEQDYKFTKNQLFKYEDSEMYGYQSTSYISDNGYRYNKQSGPIYCLDMIPKHMLGVD